MLKKTWLFTLCLPFTVAAQQTVQISGTIYDTDGAAIPYALVNMKGFTKGVYTNSQGAYTITTQLAGKQLLQVNCLGYKTVIDTLLLNNQTIFWSPRLQVSSNNLDEVVVQAGRVDDDKGMVYSNVDKEQLSKLNLGQDAPYMLNSLPNVVVNSDAGNGVGYTGMRVRGSDGTRINVTINGVPVNDAESQGTFWVDFPDLISSTDNIQLQRGVGTSANGAGAFGASINLQTNTLKEKPYAQLISTAGSYNTWRNSLLLGTGLINNKFSIDARGSYLRSDGYIDRASSNLKSYYLSAGYYLKKSVLKFITFSGYETTYQAWNYVNEDSIKAGNRRYNSCGEYYDADGKLKYYQNETDNYIQNNYQLHFVHTFNSRFSLSATAHYTKGKGYYEQYRQGESLSEYGALPFVTNSGDSLNATDLVRRLWLNNDFSGLVFNANYRASQRLSFTIGGAANTYFGKHYGQLTNVVSDQQFNPISHQYGMNTGNKNDVSAYVKTNYKIHHRINVFVDLQTRQVAYRFLGFNDSLAEQMQNVSYGFFNPKIGFNYAINSRCSAYASYSQANKEPNRDDFVQSNPSSRPKHEQLHDFETGFRFTGKRFAFMFNGYAMQYKNQLVLNGQINNVGAYNRINVASSYRRGLELEAYYTINRYLALSGNIAVSANKINGFTEYTDSYDSLGNYSQVTQTYALTDISFSPNTVGAFVATTKPIKNMELAITNKYVGRQYLDNTGNINRSIAPYNVVDIRANYRIALKKSKELVVMASVYNVLSENYATNGYTYGYYDNGTRSTFNFLAPAAPVNFLAGISLKL